MRNGLILAAAAFLAAAAPTQSLPRPQPKFAMDACTKYFPASALSAKAAGETRLAFDVAPDGETARIRVTLSSGNAALDEAAVTCAAGLRYHVNAAWHWLIAVAWRVGPKGGESLIYVPHTCESYYPPKELADSVEGTTTLSLVVRVDGYVEDIKLAHSSGNDALDKAAVQCAAAWHYIPKTVNGKPVASPLQANVVWQVPKDK